MIINTEKYNKTIDKLFECFDNYNRKQFDNNKFSLNLANGDYVTVRIPKNMIAHLLGVNVDYLKASGLIRNSMSSYESLGYFLDNSFSFHSNIDKGILKSENIFSDYIDEKLKAFSYNINIRTDDIYCIVKYDKGKTYQAEQISEISDYYIIRKDSKNFNYYILGLVKSEYSENVYVPSTSRMYTEYSDFNKFMERILSKQEITYPYAMRIDNYDKDYQNSFTLRLEDKIVLLDKISNIAKRYGASVTVAKDFSFTLSKSNLQYTNNSNIMNVLRLLSENIKNGNVLEQSVINDLYGNIELPQDVSQLIDTCNNIVCSMDINNGSAISSYSNLNDENIGLKKELEILKKEVLNYQTQINDYAAQCQLLQEQNSIYKEQNQIIEDAYQKINFLKENKGL